MSTCFICHKHMPDKSLTQLVEAIAEYRKEFEDWADEDPVLLCDDCYEERE